MGCGSVEAWSSIRREGCTEPQNKRKSSSLSGKLRTQDQHVPNRRKTSFNTFFAAFFKLLEIRFVWRLGEHVVSMLGPLGASRIIGGHLGTFGSLLVHPGHVWDTAGHIDRSARFTRSARLRAALASRFGGQTASREHLSSVPEALMLHHVGSNLVQNGHPRLPAQQHSRRFG